ncbi:MAG: general secretion pathway protein GspB [Desulfuromusa sp.]|nr:general secretion pathway protein GspB [Desulfuromusa sp.]
MLVGWFLGHFQYDQSKNAAELSTINRPLADKTVLRGSTDALSEKNDLVDHVKKSGELVSSSTFLADTDDEEPGKLEYKIEEVNPPIPVRVAPSTVNIQLEEAAQKPSAQAKTEKAVNPIQNYSELPFLIKQKLPQLEISLHFYNSKPARRIVRINGKILHENDSIKDGLIVQEIKSTTTVLNLDGYLFELNAPGG